MTWYGEKGIPVELNEPHHWGMREAPDVICVVTAYLSAYNARAFGVHDYIAQMMFNSPPGLSDAMDLAKMLACIRMVEPLTAPDFRIWRQTRTGLLSYPLDPDEARGHIAASVYLQMAVRPHIVHVVGQTEAHHAATAHDVIEACSLARRAITNSIRGAPDMTADPAIQARVEELVSEAQVTIDAIRALAPTDTTDPLIDPAVLTQSVSVGLLDAPHLRNNAFATGRVVTRIDRRGACIAVEPGTDEPIFETERISRMDL
jgi:hypothetical protein